MVIRAFKGTDTNNEKGRGRDVCGKSNCFSGDVANALSVYPMLALQTLPTLMLLKPLPESKIGV